MSSFNIFGPMDLFRFNLVNIDQFTETYSIDFYLEYITRWSGYNKMMTSVSGFPIGYLMGKVEGSGENWHSHVTVVTVSAEYRRFAMARRLMSSLEDTAEKVHNAYFVDLFVRKSNARALEFYNRLGYIVYRRVLGYYKGKPGDPDEDGLDLRKALPRNEQRSVSAVIPRRKAVQPHELEWS